jgi:hypothetical protein
MDAPSLRQRFIDNVVESQNLDHVGRQNRLFGHRKEIAERLIAAGDNGASELLPLLEHPNAGVRLAAAYSIKPFDRELFIDTLKNLVGEHGAVGVDARLGLKWVEHEDAQAAAPSPPPEPEPSIDPEWHRLMRWQEENPPPPSMRMSELEDRVLTQFGPQRARQILALARPAIGLWPQQNEVGHTPFVSKLDGRPWTPPGWQWPLYEQEPLYFLGQIHCPDLAGLRGAEHLPRQGLLAFFGDFDAISGCFPAGGGEDCAVYHWTEPELFPMAPPEPLDEEVLEPTAIAFRPYIDLPHPWSDLVKGMGFDETERERYRAIWEVLRQYGIPEEVHSRTNIDLESKLLGWPDLVQNDFRESEVPETGADPYRQLIQLPARLGPGGSLYFLIRDSDLAGGHFDRCIMEAQNT